MRLRLIVPAPVTSRAIAPFPQGNGWSVNGYSPRGGASGSVEVSRCERPYRVSRGPTPRREGALRWVIVALTVLNAIGLARSESVSRDDAPAVAEASTAAAASASALSGPATAPVWEVGDEWQYAYRSASGTGTFVWSVNRIEAVGDVLHYVIKAGTREILYRVSDLASTLERVNGVVVIRDTPSRLLYAWPLAVGSTWNQSALRERPVDRQTENRSIRRTVESEEKLTVPAGTFRTLKVAWRDANTNALQYEMWYAPDVKQWIKDRDLSDGHERELLAFKLKPPLPVEPRASDGEPPDSADLTATIAALVRKYEALEPSSSAPDAERAALAREIVEVSRFREIQTRSATELPDSMGGDTGNSKLSPKLRQAVSAALLASYRPERIVSSFERRLAETLDAATLQAGLEWERSELGRQIRRLELDASKPEARAARKDFVRQFMVKGAASPDVRGRSCAQKGIADNSVDTVFPVFEAIFVAALMADATQKGQPVEMDAIRRAVVALRPVMVGAVTQAVIADCLYAFGSLTDAQFDQWLAFLGTESGGRYARETSAALRGALLDLAEVFTRTLLDVTRRLRERGEA
jgi:hypothetical protein